MVELELHQKSAAKTDKKVRLHKVYVCYLAYENMSNLTVYIHFEGESKSVEMMHAHI